MLPTFQINLFHKTTHFKTKARKGRTKARPEGSTLHTEDQSDRRPDRSKNDQPPTGKEQAFNSLNNSKRPNSG